MTVVQSQANQCNFGTSDTEHNHEQFLVGINDSKIQEILYVMSKTYQHKIRYLALPIKLNPKDSSTMYLVMTAQKFNSE